VAPERDRPLRHLADHRDDLILGLTGDLAAALGAERLADPGEQDAQEVVDAGDGSDGAARVPAGGLLADGDGGGEPVDAVDFGPRQLVEELAGVDGQGFHVAALALGIEGVEGQAALAGAGHAGQADQPVARQVQLDAVEVMDPRALDYDFVSLHHVPACNYTRPSGGSPAALFRAHVCRIYSTQVFV
jgi:hypothetical protein